MLDADETSNDTTDFQTPSADPAPAAEDTGPTAEDAGPDTGAADNATDGTAPSAGIDQGER